MSVPFLLTITVFTTSGFEACLGERRRGEKGHTTYMVMRWGFFSVNRNLPCIFLGAFIGYNVDVCCSVKGRSMYPTLIPGDYVLFIPSFVHLLARELTKMQLVREGDIVVMQISPELRVCKRVVRTTSDASVVQYWNNLQFTVPALVLGGEPSENSGGEEETGAHSDNSSRSHEWDTCLERAGNKSALWLWLEGDNPLESFDSRHTGAMPVECLRGRVLLKIWPSLTHLPSTAPKGGAGEGP